MSYADAYRDTLSRLSTVRVITIMLVLVLSGLWSAAWAQVGDTTADAFLPTPTPTDATALSAPADASAPAKDLRSFSITDTLAKLALIVVLIYGATWGLKQWRERAIVTPSSGRGGLIRVRESVALGNSGHLYVVEFGSRNLLISAVGDQVTLLTGNSSSEMSAFDTSSLPAQEVVREEQAPEAMDGGFQQRMRDVNGARLRAENFRRTADWERKRDALVRALQESARSQAS